MDFSPPSSSIHGILQARILEWLAIAFSGGSSNPGIEPRSPALQALPPEPPGKPYAAQMGKNYAGATQSTSKTSGFQESSQCRGGQNQETTKTKGWSVKKLTHFADWYRRIPGAAVSLVLKASGGRIHLGGCRTRSSLLNSHRLSQTHRRLFPKEEPAWSTG